MTTENTTAPEGASWITQNLPLVFTLIAQLCGAVWFVADSHTTTLDLQRRITAIELVAPGSGRVEVEKRLSALEAADRDLRGTLGVIQDKVSSSNEKLARIEGQIGFLLERSNPPAPRH